MVSCSIDCLPEETHKKRRNPRGNICRSPSLYGIMLTTLGTCMESGVLWYEKLRRDVCYAGQPKEIFDQIYPEIQESNRRIMARISSLGFLIGLVLFLSSFKEGVLVPSRIVYAAIVVGSFLLNAICHSRLRAHPNVMRVTALCMVFFLLMVGMYIAFVPSTLGDRPAISFISLMVAIPLMLTDTVWVMTIVLFCASSIFLFLSHMLNSSAVFLANVTNVCAFGVLSLMFFSVMSNSTAQRIADHRHLEEEKEKNTKIQTNMIMALSSIIEENTEANNGINGLRSEYLLVEILKSLSRRKPYRNLVTDAYIENVKKAFPFREIGRVRNMRYGLPYQEQFSKADLSRIRIKCKEGGALIERTLEGLQDDMIASIAKNMILYSHENWDGTGLEGLKGEEIPLESRLVNLTETFDGLTRSGLSEPEAIKLIQSRVGIWFDPALVDAFSEVTEVYRNQGRVES